MCRFKEIPCIPCPHWGSVCFCLIWGLAATGFSVRSRYCNVRCFKQSQKRMGGPSLYYLFFSCKNRKYRCKGLQFSEHPYWVLLGSRQEGRLPTQLYFKDRVKFSVKQYIAFPLITTAIPIFCCITFMILLGFLLVMHWETRLHVCQVLVQSLILSPRWERCMQQGSCFTSWCFINTIKCKRSAEVNALHTMHDKQWALWQSCLALQ